MVTFKNKIASGLGSVLEWYDFALYIFFAPIIIPIFFPNGSSVTNSLKLFLTFSVSFFARPVGALLFGYLGDKHGRAATLKLTPILITIPTLLFSCLPTYSQIGGIAPIFLITLRIIQGICIGGEYTNNIVYLCETSSQRLYFSGSLGSCTGSIGIFLASLTATLWFNIFSESYLVTWGWRLAFALSFILGIIIYTLRKNIPETPVFKKISLEKHYLKKPIQVPLKNSIKYYSIALSLTFLPAISFYFIFIFLPTFLNETIHLGNTAILENNTLSLGIRLMIIPLVGLIADKIGGIVIARTACLLFIFLSYPLFYCLINHTNKTNLFLLGFSLLTTLNAATTPGLLVSFLKPKIRCTALSLTFNVSFGIFGGLVPIICFLLINKTGNPLSPVFYLIFAAALSFIGTFFFKRTMVCH